MTSCHTIKQVIILLIITTIFNTFNSSIIAERCKSSGNVYGENEIIDQLMACALSKTFDLDLAPRGDHTKNTPKTLIDQGFSNHTTILYAKLSGVWSARRASVVETSWRCNSNRTIATTILEVNGLALDVIERVEIPLHRNQHKLANHKPCKTHDIPLWLCRQAKPIYKTTKTWVNLAYFNLTLAQTTGLIKPKIDKLDLIFTCPETFRQKITHSPSAMYILAKYMQNIDASSQQPDSSPDKKVQRRGASDYGAPSGDKMPIRHPIAFTSVQTGKSPATPPYHNSVNLIINQAIAMLQASLNDCIQALDSDLSFAADHISFAQDRFGNIDSVEAIESDNSQSECSDKRWIVNRIDLAAEAAGLRDAEQEDQTPDYSKRNKFLISYPHDPNQLLNPYKYYLENNADRMIDRR